MLAQLFPITDNNDCLWDSMLANADQVGSQIPKTLLLFVAL